MGEGESVALKVVGASTAFKGKGQSSGYAGVWSPWEVVVTGIPSPALGHRGTVSGVCVFTVFSVILMYMTV